MKFTFIILLLLLGIQQVFPQSWTQKAYDFKALPDQMRPIPLWFWNNTAVQAAELKKQIQDIKQAGYGGVSILPFGKDFKPEYLSDAYFQAYQVSIDEAKEQGLKMHIYDEYGFPSGTAGDINGDGIGRFKQRYPEYTNRRLDRKVYPVEAGKILQLDIPEKSLMALVALDTVSFKRVNLRQYHKAGLLHWKVPVGHWKVLAFHAVDAGNSIVDYLDPKAAGLYIGMTHDEYFKRFGKDFGEVIDATFFDEPTLYYADGRTWTLGFNTAFEKAYGYDPALLYPALFEHIGPETVKARNLLFGFRSKLFSEGYIKRVNDWSKAHGIYATGHLDNEEIVNAVGTSGDFMLSFKHLDAPGIDMIGGGRPTQGFYKLISSTAYNWDKWRIMSETYGAMGNISWKEIFSIAMEQYAKGINILIPHAVWYNDQQVTFLPELSLRNPIYKDSLNQFNDYLTRLNVMLKNEGTWRGNVAVLYPIESIQADHYFGGPLSYYEGGVSLPYLDYIKVGNTLYDSLGYDFMFLHPEVFLERSQIQKGTLKLQNDRQKASFSLLVIPSSTTISLASLKKAKAFVQQGGSLVFTSQLPSRGIRPEEDAQVKSIIQQLLKMKRVTFVQDPTSANLAHVLQPLNAQFDLHFVGQAVPLIQKDWQGKRCIFLANPGEQSKSITLSVKDKFEFSLWDPHTGEIVDRITGQEQKDNRTMVKMEIPANKSIFLLEK